MDDYTIGAKVAIVLDSVARLTEALFHANDANAGDHGTLGPWHDLAGLGSF